MSQTHELKRAVSRSHGCNPWSAVDPSERHSRNGTARGTMRSCVVEWCRDRLQKGVIMQMVKGKKAAFDITLFLATAGPGRKIVHFKPKQRLFSQGATANSVFYLQAGRAKLTVVSKRGKEATVTLLAAGDFTGEESITADGGLRMATATAIVARAALEIQSTQM